MSAVYKGLTTAQVIASRAEHGVNLLTPPEREPLWKQFLAKFKDPLIVILLIAGAASVGISCYEYYGLGMGETVFFEPIGIFMAVLLATGLSFVFEVKANREFDLLNRVNDDEPVRVIRDGRPCQIPRRDVVVGDIVMVDTGQEIPADGRLLESVSLNVDESSLTGEPLCHKSEDSAQADPQATYPTDMLLRGTKVMEGHGVMEVTAVGDATENGKVYTASRIDDTVRTPLDEQLDRLGRLVTVGSYVIAALIFAGRIIQYFIAVDSFSWVSFMAYLLQTVMIAVTLIVVAVPEGLPMAVTLALAYSMRRMLATNNLVRKLHACETMGAVTVICTDKTGTLTRNRMQVYQMDIFGKPDKEWFYATVAANSTAQLDRSGDVPAVLGNPTEGALLLWLESQGHPYEPLRDSVERLAELPFSTERKYMAMVVRMPDGDVWLLLKGAPEIVIGMCADVGGTDVSPSDIEALLTDYQSRGMRTLAFAAQRITDDADIPSLLAGNALHADRLRLTAVAAISDPVRDDVPEAIRQVRAAGIEVKIVTGDTPATAREIGRQTGLWNDAEDSDRNIITGAELEKLTDKELYDRVSDLRIIARARPMDKKRLVEALQAHNQVVAVTGDGTNDAPALKAAHVGLSMGDGTSVAKEASDITIVDNSFASIGRAVLWGRSLYRNIQRFILFQLTVNVAACLTVLAGAFMGTESPLTVTQMLWVNLIMDTFAAMALSSLPPSDEVMHDRPRRRSDFILTRAMGVNITVTGFLFWGIMMGLLVLFEHTRITCLTDLLHPSWGGFHYLSAYELSLFFSIFVFLQFWNMFNARAYDTGRSALRLRGCGEFVWIAAAIFTGQLLIVNLGGTFFNVTPIGIVDWLIIIIGTSPVLWIGEMLRLRKR